MGEDCFTPETLLDTHAVVRLPSSSLTEGLDSSAHDSRQQLGLLPGCPLPVTPACFAFVSKQTLPWLPLNRKLASLKAKQNQLERKNKISEQIRRQSLSPLSKVPAGHGSVDTARERGEKPLSLGSQAWGSQGLGFRAAGTGGQNLLCAPLWAGGKESRLPALSRSQYLGLGHTGKRGRLLLLQRPSRHGGSQCRSLPVLSAFPPSPLFPASPEHVPLLCPLSGPGLRDITWFSPRWLRG